MVKIIPKLLWCITTLFPLVMSFYLIEYLSVIFQLIDYGDVLIGDLPEVTEASTHTYCDRRYCLKHS